MSIGGRGSPRSAGGGMVASGLAMFAGAFLCVVALTLGIVSLFQRRRKLFGILGICFSGLIILIFAAIMVIGLIARK
ncbi:MAG TPA: hypothetical protein VFC78_08895 [Tepidisphaeraceae bacterium]|nr:hypothetical protein [Tepidisphaeraceae bacterium]